MPSYREIIAFQDTRQDQHWMPIDQQDEYVPYHMNVHDLSWSPDNRKIAAASHDNTIRIWDLEGSNSLPYRILTITRTGYPISVAWSRNINFIAAGDTNADPIRIFDIEQGQELKKFYGHQSWPLSIDWSPSGHYIISASMAGEVILWDSTAEDSYCPQDIHLEKRSTFSTVRWCSRMNRVAVFSCEETIVDSRGKEFRRNLDPAIYVLDTTTWQVTHKLTTDFRGAGMGRFLDWSPNGEYLAILGDRATIHLWKITDNAQHVTTLQPHIAPTHHNSRFYSISWNSDGRRLAYVDGIETLYLWEDGIPQPSITIDNENGLHTVQWSPDGQYLATGSTDGKVRVYSK